VQAESAVIAFLLVLAFSYLLFRLGRAGLRWLDHQPVKASKKQQVARIAREAEHRSEALLQAGFMEMLEATRRAQRP
jgi:hypothetical protein